MLLLFFFSYLFMNSSSFGHLLVVFGLFTLYLVSKVFDTLYYYLVLLLHCSGFTKIPEGSGITDSKTSSPAYEKS